MTHSLADEAIVLEESRRSAQARLHEAEEQGRADITGHTFLFRDAMEMFLRSALRVRLGRSLTASESGMVKCVAIALWAEHARQFGIGVKIITEEHHQLVTKAQEQKAQQEAVGTVTPLNLDGMSWNAANRALARSLEAALPGQTRPGDGRNLRMPRRD